jgi:hypothetical protein
MMGPGKIGAKRACGSVATAPVSDLDLDQAAIFGLAAHDVDTFEQFVPQFATCRSH